MNYRTFDASLDYRGPSKVDSEKKDKKKIKIIALRTGP